MHVSKRKLHHAGRSFGGEGVALLFVRDSVPEDAQPLIVGPRIRVVCRQPQAERPNERAGGSMRHRQKQSPTALQVRCRRRDERLS